MLKLYFQNKRCHFSVTAVVLFVFATSAFSTRHPHMIVTESDFAALNIKAQTWPWSVMKSKAISSAKNLTYSPSASLGSKCTRIHEMASVCALAYILDEANRPLYIEKVETQIAQGIDAIRTAKGSNTDHGYNVAPAHAAFMVYLLLDIMYSDLSPEIRQEMEDDCDFIAANHVQSWRSSEYAIKGMMELYHNGNTAVFESIKNDYKNYILDLISDDGVYTTGPGYTKSRIFMDNRMQKKIFMDICEYQGYHEFYSHPKLQKLYEWVLGYTTTPFNRSYTFGDSPPTKDLDHWAVSALRLDRFSETAAGIASWKLGPLNEDSIIGGLLHFLFCDTIPAAPLRPKSRVFKNGGAWLLENSDSEKALAAALWNINTAEDSHKHFDVNAVHIAGYGAHIVRNSGYDGYGKPDPVTWEWIRRTAESSNTVMMNNQNHSSFQGGGIEEDLLGGDFEYACGNSGSALPMGRHRRNMIFVRPIEGLVNGYFIFIDQLQTAFPWDANALMNIAWHPNSSQMPEINETETKFSWGIEGCDYGGDGVGVSIFPITPTKSWEIRDGYLASYSSCSRFVGKYLYNTYQCSENQAIALTVIYPSDINHDVAAVETLDIDGGDGCRIQHQGSVVDYAIVSQDSLVHFEDVAFAGTSALWREQDGNLTTLFANHSTKFLQRNSAIKGFHAGNEISIYIKENIGKVITKGSEITFWANGIKDVKINDSDLEPLASGENWVTVYIDSGKHDIELETVQTTVPQETMTDLSFQLYQNYPNPFNNSTVIKYSLTQPVHVELSLYNVEGQLIEILVDDVQSAGNKRVNWNADGLPNGIYFGHLSIGETIQTIKMVLVK